MYMTEYKSYTDEILYYKRYVFYWINQIKEVFRNAY